MKDYAFAEQLSLYDLFPAEESEKSGRPLDVNCLLHAVASEARAAGIPISDKISPRVQINRRATGRFGACIRRPDGSFVIELSDRLVTAPELSCRQTLAHELLHTCYGCQNHKKRWHTYADKMNEAYGYRIMRTDTPEALGVEMDKSEKYVAVCVACGMEFPRTRRSRLISHPEYYRCSKCGGKLRVKRTGF